MSDLASMMVRAVGKELAVVLGYVAAVALLTGGALGFVIFKLVG